MSLEDAFKNTIVLNLKKENQELHEAVARKSRELLVLRSCMATEWCPHCEYESSIEWNVIKYGYQAFCPHCGKKMMLCSECLNDRDYCDWDGEQCYRTREGREELDES